MAIDRWQMRRDTAAGWADADPVLADGEPGFEKGSGRLKIGDGVTPWTSLAYVGDTGGAGGGSLVEDPAYPGLYTF